ncbi:MAG: AAA family ATPase [Advenella sp.]|uniref:ATPase n=1 Tax=Advenella kashmirensis TaxID=310575 RepID=A0A356LD79_9BURK|nr:AAA family ATPase [Advenella sp. FME57]HBP28728.1 ATPase [Advenella kashmirensis]
MNPQSANFFVLTGGPGSGKTTLINHLADMGYRCMPEAGRAVIRQQLNCGGVALPWADKTAYARRMHEHDMAAYQRACNMNGPVFFDRSIVDIIAYLQLEQLPVPEPLQTAVSQCRYHTTAFILPPWPQIYRRDQERRQDLPTAIATYHAMMKTYLQYGYALVRVPRLPAAQRARFIVNAIACGHGGNKD